MLAQFTLPLPTLPPISNAMLTNPFDLPHTSPDDKSAEYKPPFTIAQLKLGDQLALSHTTGMARIAITLTTATALASVITTYATYI